MIEYTLREKFSGAHAKETSPPSFALTSSGSTLKTSALLVHDSSEMQK